MSNDEGPRPELRFGDQIEYYDTTDFAQLAGEVANDAWIGTGDATATIALHRNDGSVEQVYLPVQVDNGPVTCGARFTVAVENVTRLMHGEATVQLTELLGAEASGASSWSVFYAPIRSPFD